MQVNYLVNELKTKKLLIDSVKESRNKGIDNEDLVVKKRLIFESN